jgi:adenine deaminase
MVATVFLPKGPRDPSMARLLAVARGAEEADVVLTNLRLVNVLTGEVRAAEVALAGSRIAALGQGLRGRRTCDLGGRLLCPGLIDAHVHLESSLVRPAEYARAVVPRGVTTVIANPHEIANVLGAPGLRLMLEEGRGLPLQILITVPSSVPATPLATAGACLTRQDLEALAREPGVIGLGEVMNVPGVVAGDPDLLKELHLFRHVPMDGHCPGLSGPPLNAYIAAGISSDHESVSRAEVEDKLHHGLHLFLREGSAARNLRELLPAMTPWNERWLSLCTDDREPDELLQDGGLDHVLRLAIASGVNPVAALRLATLNPAEHYRLDDRGLIAPGRRADLVAVDDLRRFEAHQVWQDGVLVAAGGALVSAPLPSPARGSGWPDTMRVDVTDLDFTIAARPGAAHVIGVHDGQLLTDKLLLPPTCQRGQVIADASRDLAKLAAVERHRGSGRCGLGLVQGFGLQRGALAGSVAHDHHNLLVLGMDDRSMATAVEAVVTAGGGLAVACGRELLALLPLPLAGLMAVASIEQVAAESRGLIAAARALGCSLQRPFMTLSFLGLEVIPALKLTDLGLVDVAAGRLVPLFLDPPGGKL